MNGKTVLRKKKIAVISKRRRVSDFLRLEAESCSCAVSVMSVVPPELSEFDVVIIDDDGSHIISEVKDHIYRIVPDGGETNERAFTWPVPVENIRGIFEGYVTESADNTEERDGTVIYLPKKSERTVIYKNRRIEFTESEWKVFECLYNADGGAVSRDALMKLFDTEEGNITDVYICHLRRKLEAPFGVKLIKTLRGKGYSLSAKVKVSELL